MTGGRRVRRVGVPQRDRTLIDLRECRSRFRVEPEVAGDRDPWRLRIRGRRGHIVPWDGDRLAAFVCGTNMVRRADRLPFAETVQGHAGPGATELVIAFDPDHLDDVATLIQARRRRKLSPEVRARVIQRLRSLRSAPRRPRTAERRASRTEVRS